MGFPEPDPNKSSFVERIYLFMASRIGCWAALVCLFGGLLCAWGIGHEKLWATVVGAILMAPYALSALVIVPVLFGFTVFVLSFIAWVSLRDWWKRKSH